MKRRRHWRFLVAFRWAFLVMRPFVGCLLLSASAGFSYRLQNASNLKYVCAVSSPAFHGNALRNMKKGLRDQAHVSAVFHPRGDWTHLSVWPSPATHAILMVLRREKACFEHFYSQKQWFMHTEEHNHCFMHYFGVKTLSETPCSPPLMQPGYGAR